MIYVVVGEIETRCGDKERIMMLVDAVGEETAIEVAKQLYEDTSYLSKSPDIYAVESIDVSETALPKVISHDYFYG